MSNDTPDTSFIETGDIWDSSDWGDGLSFTFLGGSASAPLPFSSYTSNLLTVDTYELYHWNDSHGLIKFTANSDTSVLDQQDVTRFLLDSPEALTSYSGADPLATVLVNIVNDPLYHVNYRVSFSDVINLSITEQGSSPSIGDIILANGFSDQNDKYGLSWLPPQGINQLMDSGDSFININADPNIVLDSFSFQSQAYFTILHELGHSVGGLTHDNGFPADYLNSERYTIMSGNTFYGTNPIGLQLLDIAALQEQYGSRNYSTRSGDTTYSLGHGLGVPDMASTSPLLTTIWDGHGTDVIDASAFSNAAQIDLRQGRFSSIGYYSLGTEAYFDQDTRGHDYLDNPDNGNVAIAYHTVIENAIGTNGADSLIGNDWDNTLYGGGGDDNIYGDGAVYDGNHGFTAIDPNDANDPNASKPTADHDILLGGLGDDHFYGGLGSDIIHGGFVKAEIDALSPNWDAAGQFSPLTDIAHTNDGTDTADYSKLTGMGINVDVSSDGDTVYKGDASGTQGIDHLISIEKIIGTQHGDDTFHAAEPTTTGSGGALPAIEGDSGRVFFTPPPGETLTSSFYVNEGHDVLDLTAVTDKVTVLLGAGTVDSDANGITTILGGTTASGTVTFSDTNASTLHFSGLESITLGGGDDTAIVGKGVGIEDGTQGLHATIDMGAGDNTVQLWGAALLSNGTLQTADGTEVSNFQKIDFAQASSTTISGQQEVYTLELGHQYSSESYADGWINYKGLGAQTGHSLTFTEVSTANGLATHVTDAAGQAQDTIHNPDNINIVGTDNGDTFDFSAGAHGLVYLGTGDDVVHAGNYSSAGFYYTGGHDVFDGKSITVSLDAATSLSDVSIAYSSAPSSVEHHADYAVNAYDVILTDNHPTGGAGTITLKGDITQTVHFGADGIQGTADDTTDPVHFGNDTVVIQNMGILNLTMQGAASLSSSIHAGTYIGGAPPVHIADVNAVSGNSTSGDDNIIGGFGADTIDEGDGADRVYGGFGDDIIHGGNGNDYITGAAGNDHLYGDAGNDVISGDAGNDIIDGGTGVNVLSGGSGQDTYVIADSSSNTILDYSIEDGDVIRLSDTMSGHIENATVNGYDLIVQGDTTLKGYLSDGADVHTVMMDFGGGAEAVQFNADGTIVSNAVASESADHLLGTNNAETVITLGGDDIVYGFGGDDTLNSGDGNDTLLGGDGNDTLIGADGNDHVYGGAGNDLIVAASGAGNDYYDGGSGNDTIEFMSATQGVSITLDASGGSADGAQTGHDQFINIENIITSPGDDTVTVLAGAAPVSLAYEGGNDVFTLSSAVHVSLSFDNAISSADVQAGSIVSDGNGHITEADFTITGHGSLTLHGDDLSGQTVHLGDGSEYAVTADGISSALAGTSGNDVLAYSSSYHAYDGIAGNDTVDFSAVTNDMTVSLHDGSGAASGADIGNNYLLNIDNVITGAGNDAVAVTGSGTVTYTGGNDVYTLSGDASEVHVSIANPIVAGDVAVNGFTSAGGHITSAAFDVAGLGTLTLQGDALEGHTVDLADGDKFVITTTGIDTPSTYFGTEGNDVINPPDGYIKVSALGGDDTIMFRPGITQYDGGAGFDTLDLSAAGTVSVSGYYGTIDGSFGHSNYAHIEKIITGSGNDDIDGDYNNNDTIQSGGGNDEVHGNYGDDTFIATLNDGNDIYNGGDDNDTLDCSFATHDIVVNLMTGNASGADIGTDTLSSIENIYTGSGNDTITASASGGILAGGAGDDVYNIDLSVPPIPVHSADSDLISYATIVDTSGHNILNLTTPGGEIGTGVGFTDNPTDIALTAIGYGYPEELDHYVVLKDWFNHSGYPVSEIVVTGLDGETRTYTKDEINSGWTPIAQTDDINAQHLLTASGNVLVDNGHGADSIRTFGNIIVTAGTFTTTNGGTVELHADGSFTYTGKSGFSGNDSFTYTITDSRILLTSIGTVNINDVYDQPNRAPVAENDVLDAQNSLSAHGNLLSNDTDPDHNTLSTPLQIINSAHGTVLISSDGTASYHAQQGYRGEDSFTYTVQDSHGATSTASVAVENIFSNIAPVTADLTVSESANGTAIGNVLTYTTDPNGDSFFAQAGTYQTQHGGQVTIAQDGSFAYQSASGHAGDDSFAYTLEDQYGATSSATVTINGTVVANQPPIAQNDVLDALHTGHVTGNVLADNGHGADSDPDGNSLSVLAQSITTAHGGHVDIASNGDVAYQAVDGYRGADSFSYTLQDGQGGTAQGTVEIDNIFTNRAPVPTADQFDASHIGTAAGNVLANDSDPDGDALSVAAQTITTAHGATVEMMTDGSFTFTAQHGYSGADSFSYTLDDSAGGVAIGTVGVSNIFADTAPIAHDDHFAGYQNMAMAGNLLVDNGAGADSDPDGDALSVLAQTIATEHGGQVVVSANGDFSYTPAAHYVGEDGFSYTLSDSLGATSVGHVGLTLLDHAPVAQPDVFTTAYGQTVHGNVLADNGYGADSDADGDLLHVIDTSVTTVHGQTVALNADGSFIYTPSEDFIGNDSFTYNISDGHDSETSASTVSLHIAVPSDALIGTPDADMLNGTSRTSSIYGLGGNDTIHGGSHDNLIYAGSGDDAASGGSNNDSIYGESGNDNLQGGSGNDALYGGDGNDTITGGSGNDTLDGGNGNDHLDGGSGNDMLFGGFGDDIMFGGSGDDTFYGGDGSNTMTGNSGANIFVFQSVNHNGTDTITDFNYNAGDKIDLHDVLTPAYDPVHDHLNDFIHLTANNGNTVVSVDADGTGASYSFVNIVTLAGITNLPDVDTMMGHGNLVV